VRRLFCFRMLRSGTQSLAFGIEGGFRQQLRFMRQTQNGDVELRFGVYVLGFDERQRQRFAN